MIVPPCTGKTREVTPAGGPGAIRTALVLRDCISATYTDVREYVDPNDAPIYARMKPAGAGKRGRWSRRWEGEIVLQVVQHTEVAALAELLEHLAAHELPHDAAAARAVLVALASATSSTPWELCPLGARRAKPRRIRKAWKDPTTGARTMYYPDTLRPHADPNCTCSACVTMNKLLRSKKATAKK